MGVSLHPSQKRSSCEACRKHKLRCKREESDNGRCSRCSRLNLECVLGAQKKVGRPRRAPADGAAQPPATLDANDSSLLSFEHAFGTLEGGFAAPDLTPFYYQSPSSGLATSTTTAANMSALVEFSYEGSQPWDALNIPSFDDASMGSTPSQWPSSSDSPSASTPTSISSVDECRIDFGNLYGAPSDKPIDALEAMAFLSKMNLDIHARTLAIARHKNEINFVSIVCNHSPLYIENTTLVQFMICATQDLVQILSRLRSTRPETERPVQCGALGSYGLLASFNHSPAVSPSSLFLSSQGGSSTAPSTPGHVQSQKQQPESEPISPPIYFLIASIFVQLISAYETVLYHTAARMICAPAKPLPEMKDVMVGGLTLKDSCSMGIIFTELVTSLLERSERMLGIDPMTMNGHSGLLSVDQKESLWRELGGCRGVSVGKARSSSVRVGLANAKRAFLEAAMA
ncbi:hypothetical protein F5X68DRAFT_54937 [Plectosphaerella plurivora]|uniref:Zn(2)-C6 fungal-type domain-containing protein n=1 Tax=Plectosphaerella plurivora TaxID=936078 RepID=A0A9P9A420_9PEZI|nr:hypothetical protein F5X68DRAFT_54937 [Plectosphaerella plurivora]